MGRLLSCYTLLSASLIQAPELTALPKGLDTEESANIRIFQRNTPSVVNITNIRRVPVRLTTAWVVWMWCEQGGYERYNKLQEPPSDSLVASLRMVWMCAQEGHDKRIAECLAAYIAVGGVDA